MFHHAYFEVLCLYFIAMIVVNITEGISKIAIVINWICLLFILGNYFRVAKFVFGG